VHLPLLALLKPIFVEYQAVSTEDVNDDILSHLYKEIMYHSSVRLSEKDGNLFDYSSR
jgi:hypothetical protein